MLKEPLSHPTAIFSAVLISQWPAQFQLSEIQAAGLNSSVRLEKCNQMLESYRAVLSPEREQRLLVSSSEKEEINVGTWKGLANRNIILQGIAGTSRLSWGESSTNISTGPSIICFFSNSRVKLFGRTWRAKPQTGIRNRAQNETMAVQQVWGGRKAQWPHTTTDKSAFINGEGMIWEIPSWRQLVERTSLLRFHYGLCGCLRWMWQWACYTSSQKKTNFHFSNWRRRKYTK